MKRDDRSIHWQTVFALWLALTLSLPAMELSAETNPKAPGCQTEVVDRGKRLGVGHYLPGIKIWRLDLHKIGPNRKPVYQYTFEDSRNCWLIFEGWNLEVTTFMEFHRLPEIAFIAFEPDIDPISIRSLHAHWEDKTKERCDGVSDVSLKDSYSELNRKCADRSYIRNLRIGHRVTIRADQDSQEVTVTIHTQHKKIWGMRMRTLDISRLSENVVGITYIYDVDLMATNP